MASAVFLMVVLLRFVVPLFIPRFPLPAVVASLVIDAADQTIFQALTDDPLTGYQAYDKALDVYYLAIAYVSTMRNWRDPVAFGMARGLYLYRLVGVALFELLHWRWLLLVFPNTFEYFFIAYEAVATRWNPRRLPAAAVVSLAGFIWVFVKLPQEWWIHIAKMDFSEFMGDHPYLWAVLAGLAVVAGVVIARRWRTLPAPDWPFTFDVDRRLPAVEAVRRRPSLRDPVLLEKVVILALICVIFAQVLPDVRSSNAGVAAGSAFLVIANAFVSEWWYRRGHTWPNALSAFATMLAINLAIGIVDAVLGDGDLSANTVFFMVLLALLIAMYDRMRATRGPGDRRLPVAAALRLWWRDRQEAAPA